MNRLLALAVLAGLVLALGAPLADAGKKNKDKDVVKEALQEFNDYIGQWKGNGTVADDKFLIWTENADWSWRFKGKDSWLELKVPDGRKIKSGELRYLPDDEVYQFTVVDKEGKKTVYKGTIKGTRLILEHLDPTTKEGRRLEMYMAGDIRFIYVYKEKPATLTDYYPRVQVAYTRKGEDFGSKEKRPVCVVTGGLGTIQVSYEGKTYYVCCSGCRDAFNENPAKIIAEYEKKKKKK
jgi:YHS domain-containing protein